MKYDFDRIIDRKGTNCLNVEGWRGYIFKCGPERKFAYADDEFVRMWVADMEFAVAPEIRQAIKDRVDREIFGYTLVYDPDYVKAFQNWCESRYGWTFPAEQLTYSAGVIPALYQLTEDLVAKDEKIITFTPAYGFFLHACEYNGIELLQSPLKCEHGKWSLDWDDFEAKAADPKAKLLMLCNPHNPTGYIWTEEELKRIGEICAKHDLWIVSDEIHCDLVRTGL
ncbi:MAG: aminotransferase class I/II-fold pyridoxal phosphate-dependent enzyme, partial [Firmicutes bacterium]|nr:aminotransferase class I/II-fold pyridoxal phosphate-dependent enzyme [Bacillota bacterium]